MIEVKELSKYYGDKLAVDKVSFSVKEGEILGFLGPNGAGKSTVMNIISGYIGATSGQVIVNGKDVSEEADAKKYIGYLPEIPPLYMEMTVMEYLIFMYRLKKVEGNREERCKALDVICKKTGLAQVKGRVIRNLSKGYRQRVGIAQAMVGDPPVLILDEPTVGLDPNQMVEVRNLIRRLGEKHTVILSSHILQEIQAVSSRVLILNEGKVIADGTWEELSKQLGEQKHRENMSLEEVFVSLTLGGRR